MKLRTLQEIEEDERRDPTPARFPAAPAPTMADLRPGLVKRFLLGFGELLLFLPKLFMRLLDAGLAIAIVLGLVGCIVFGLVYLFG